MLDSFSNFAAGLGANERRIFLLIWQYLILRSSWEGYKKVDLRNANSKIQKSNWWKMVGNTQSYLLRKRAIKCCRANEQKKTAGEPARIIQLNSTSISTHKKQHVKDLEMEYNFFFDNINKIRQFPASKITNLSDTTFCFSFENCFR